MKKLSLALLALAVGFASSTAVLADSLDFNFSGPITNGPAGTITLSGVFTTAGTPNTDGGVAIASFTGSYADSEDGVSGLISLVPGVGSYENHPTSADGSWWYDNLYYPHANAPGTVGGQFDLQGLLFYVGTSTDPTEWEVNFWANGSTTYQLEESVTGSQGYYLNSASGIGITNPNQPLSLTDDGPSVSSLQITSTPEPAPLVLLGLGLFAMALLTFFKARPSSLVLHS